MIRKVADSDIPDITNICNYYILNSTAVFDEVPVREEDMLRSMNEIVSAGYPYLVWEENGAVLGYCYAHKWKSKAAYRFTLETTVYLAPDATGKGIGTKLIHRLADECRAIGTHSLIACITDENEGSLRLHRRLGFKDVSKFGEVGLKFGRWLGIIDLQLIL
jgi:phosphinothricin acetyltransferase